MPIGNMVNKSFFKSQLIAANIPCVLNELNALYRLTDADMRVCVCSNFILTSQKQWRAIYG